MEENNNRDEVSHLLDIYKDTSVLDKVEQSSFKLLTIDAQCKIGSCLWKTTV